MASVGELQKVVALLTAWSKNLGAPGLEFPAALKGSGIPQRSALLLTGLLTGVPTKSSHMDGISTNAVIAEHSINATVAVLQNIGAAVATGVLAGQSISESTGPGFYDNTQTNWAALLDEGDAGRYNLGLSGDEAIAGMLGVLSAAPRVTGDAAAIAKFKALDKSTFTSKHPTILLTLEADRLVFAGNTARYVDKKRAVYEAELAKWEASKANLEHTLTHNSDSRDLHQVHSCRTSRPHRSRSSFRCWSPDIHQEADQGMGRYARIGCTFWKGSDNKVC
jgi:hypothetical protein